MGGFIAAVVVAAGVVVLCGCFLGVGARLRIASNDVRFVLTASAWFLLTAGLLVVLVCGFFVLSPPRAGPL